MKEKTIAALYEYGKKVYSGELDINSAAKAVNESFPDAAESSARHYISWYSCLRNGEVLTWNTTPNVLLYYVEEICKEEGKDIASLAYSTALTYGKEKGKKELLNELPNIKNKYDLKEIKIVTANEAAFEKWLEETTELKQTTIKRYIKALKLAGPWMGLTIDNPILNITEMTEYRKVESKITSLTNFDELNQAHNHGDLSAAMSKYKEFLSQLPQNAENVMGKYPPSTDPQRAMTMTVKEAVSEIKKYIASRGFSYTDELIENFYLSLKSKPFVILAGTSGTGKTKLVSLFAEAIGAKFNLVSVRPDWSDGSDLFGHTDLNGDFIKGPVCECFEYAYAHPDEPVILCLDEMNLARVEYYLSDFLSIIETRKWADDGSVQTMAIAQYDQGIPENLYFVGTVNMDETTFPFSKKVLDRANTIEFSSVDLMPDFESAEGEANALELPNSFLKTDYLVLTKDCADEQKYVIDICTELKKLNEILEKANAHVGYRVRDEIVFYMLNNKRAGNLLTDQQAMDNEIMQKILPRLQGSSAALKTLMQEVFEFCMGSDSGFDKDGGEIGKKMQDTAKSAKYPASAKKIGYMMTRFEEDGFTSFWL